MASTAPRATRHASPFSSPLTCHVSLATSHQLLAPPASKLKSGKETVKKRSSFVRIGRPTHCVKTAKNMGNSAKFTAPAVGTTWRNGKNGTKR